MAKFISGKNSLFLTANVKSCSCCNGHNDGPGGISRRKFVQSAGTSLLGSVVLSGLSWPALAGMQIPEQNGIRRKSLIVKPVLVYETPRRREMSSWRQWGGIQSEKDAGQESLRIKEELKGLQDKADFPVEFLPVAPVKQAADLNNLKDIGSADTILVYAAGGSGNILDSLQKTGKNLIFFCRHRSGPVYLWYEIISPRFLRKQTDRLAVSGTNDQDVVVDDQDDILWRLRALCGLKNTLKSGIIAIGGPGGWGQPKAPALTREKFGLDIRTVTYEDLGKLISEAKSDSSLKLRVRSRADEYLRDKKLKLETKSEFVENCFLLEEVFIRLMEKNECRAITINNCMSTIMPVAETSACLTLSLLNDAGYLAFCESDFVVVPTGILLANISGKPVFLNDPTYPHHGMITLAHCTAPRRMDGKNLEPARLLTHFESDFGAAPKVEMKLGQSVTNIIPDFEFRQNAGFMGKIIDNPFLDICRSQIDISYTCDSRLLAEQMPGFHWITAYGEYLKEFEYALKKTGIDFKVLG